MLMAATASVWRTGHVESDGWEEVRAKYIELDPVLARYILVRTFVLASNWVKFCARCSMQPGDRPMGGNASQGIRACSRLTEYDDSNGTIKRKLKKSGAGLHPAPVL